MEQLTSTSFTPVQPLKATVVSGDKPGVEQLTSTSFAPVQPIKATVVSGDKPGFETGVKDGIGRWVEGERQTGEIHWVVTLQSLQSAEETTKSVNPSRTGDEEWEGRGGDGGRTSRSSGSTSDRIGGGVSLRCRLVGDRGANKGLEVREAIGHGGIWGGGWENEVLTI